ncbi:hypothetical protein [Nocardiopsis nanhaiensis]
MPDPESLENATPAPVPALLTPRLWHTVQELDLPVELLSDIHEIGELIGDTLLDAAAHLESVDRPDRHKKCCGSSSLR